MILTFFTIRVLIPVLFLTFQPIVITCSPLNFDHSQISPSPLSDTLHFPRSSFSEREVELEKLGLPSFEERDEARDRSFDENAIGWQLNSRDWIPSSLKNSSETVAASALTGKLVERQRSCEAGYGYCSNSGRCCPSNTRCCDTGYCVIPGGECCRTRGSCEPGWRCCSAGTCYPEGGQCCSDGRYCPSGSVCVSGGRCRLGSGSGGGSGGDDGSDATTVSETTTAPPTTGTGIAGGGDEIEWFSTTYYWYFWYYYIQTFSTYSIITTEHISYSSYLSSSLASSRSSASSVLSVRGTLGGHDEASSSLESMASSVSRAAPTPFEATAALASTTAFGATSTTGFSAGPSSGSGSSGDVSGALGIGLGSRKRWIVDRLDERTLSTAWIGITILVVVAIRAV